MNFIDIEDFEESVDNLAELPDIREVYMQGCPCTDWEHWQDYLMARIPTLGRIDGTDVTKTMRMRAKQKLQQMENDLPQAARARIEKKVLEEQSGEKKNGYTKEFRRECYQDQVRQKEEQKKRSEENSMFKDYNEYNESLNQKREIPVYNKDGRIRLANEGRYEWRFDES